MKIKYNDIRPIPPKPLTFDEFAEKHDLTMIVTRHQDLNFTAHFEDVEVKDSKSDCILTSNWGVGVDQDQAINSYAEYILGKVLVYKAYYKDLRREIECPKKWKNK